MTRRHSLFVPALCVLLLASSPRLHAQAQPSIALVCDAPPALLDAAALRDALERELDLAITIATEPTGPTLRIQGATLNAIEVSFVRVDRASVGRTIDLSASGTRVVDTLALLAANLLRDEAAELLPQLEPPQPTAAKPAPTRLQLCPGIGLRRVPIGVDFLPYVGMSSLTGVQAERSLSVNVLGGITGGVHGAEFGGLFNLDEVRLCGVQMAGVFNRVGGQVSGAQFAMINLAAGPVVGAQFGFVNLNGALLHGAQLGFVNVTAGDATGVQAGFVNIIAGDGVSAQLGFANLDAGLHLGLQAGFANVSGHGVRGVQLGFLNVASDDVAGAQIGLLNTTAGRNHGAMVGLVNVAEDADAAVGLVNVLWHGRTQLDAWATDAGLLMAGITHGSRLLHNIYGIGVKPMGGSPALGLALGIGVRTFQQGRLSLDIDAVNYGLLAHDSTRKRMNWGQIAQLRIPLTITLVTGVAVFVAPEVSVSIAKSDTNLTDPALYKTTRLTHVNAQETVRIWPGLSLGLRFL